MDARQQHRHAATNRDGDDTQYSLTIDAVAHRYAEASHPRTIRTLQRYCAGGHLDCLKAPTQAGDMYLVTPQSVARHLGELDQIAAATSVAISRDVPRPSATTDAAQLQAPTTKSEFAKAASEKKSGLQPLDYLQTDWDTRDTLSVSPGTLAYFGAGYAPKGMMQGRLAVPLHDNGGNLVTYVGVALKPEEPQVRYKFPKDFVPDLIFNTHRVEAGILYVITKGEILSVLQAFENGVANCAAVMGNFTVDQTERLLVLMRDKGIEALELF